MKKYLADYAFCFHVDILESTHVLIVRSIDFRSRIDTQRFSLLRTTGSPYIWNLSRLEI